MSYYINFKEEMQGVFYGEGWRFRQIFPAKSQNFAGEGRRMGETALFNGPPFCYNRTNEAKGDGRSGNDRTQLL